MSRAKLSAAASHFFNRILPAITKTPPDKLPNLEVLVGAYRRYAGAELPPQFGQKIKPEFMLKVNPTAVPLQGGVPVLGEAEVGNEGGDQPLVWLRFAADAQKDDKATILDLMGDLDTYAQKKLSIAGVDVEIPGDIPAPPNATAWADAITANRAAIPNDLAPLTDVPDAFKKVTSSLLAFKLILSHFFTFDSTGKYYERWSGTGRKIPDDLSDVYKKNNVQEFKLARDEMFVYMLAPKSLFTPDKAEPHDYVECVIRFDETGDPTNPVTPTLVHSVYKRMKEGTPPLHDFVFFESEDGIGLNVPLAARDKMTAVLINFLLSIPDVPEERTRFFHEANQIIEGTPPLIQLTATVDGPVTFPEGAVPMINGSGTVITVLSPLDKVVDIALLPALIQLDLTGMPQKPHLDLVRAAIHFDDFRAKFAAGAQDGAGVLVGIIDTGIDGSHAAFNDAAGNSRIVAVWEQDGGGAFNPNCPFMKHPANVDYSPFVYGRERTGADVVNSADNPEEGHGTHVAGIAAGAAVTSASGNVPRGIASAAKIVAVKCIAASQGNVQHALQYILVKAKELDLPCVVNMSFGSQDNAHDGTDELTHNIVDLMRDNSDQLLKGRILVASAGNDGRDPIHVRRDLAAGNSTVIRFSTSGLGRGRAFQSATFWIRNLAPGPKPNLLVTVRHNASGWTGSAVTASSTSTQISLTSINIKIVINYGDQNASNGDYNLRIDFSRISGSTGLPFEEWGITIVNISAAIEMHGWALGTARFEGVTPADNSVKVSAPGAGRDVVCVACSSSRLNWPNFGNPTEGPGTMGETRLGDITSFSSPGPHRLPTFHKVGKKVFSGIYPALDITAPGSATQSALASNIPLTVAQATAMSNALGLGLTGPQITKLVHDNRDMLANNNSWFMQGTSMAAPVITGLIACILSTETKLTQSEVVNRIHGAGEMPAGTATVFKAGAPDANSWGSGLVNAPKLKP